MSSTKFTLISYLLIFFSIQINAQNVLDNPLVVKLSGYELIYSESKFDEIEFPMSEVDIFPISGNKTFATFKYDKSGAYKHPNANQIIQTYFDKVKSLRGKPLFKGSNYGSFQVRSNTKKFWCILETHEDGATYTITIIEQEKIQEAETAQEMLEMLKSKGEVNLYFQFSTGSANLSQASFENIKEVAKLMNQFAPRLNLSIEGHTDNVGNTESNKKLSLQRAVAVKNELIKNGVKSERLEPIGWGSEKPIAPNSTEVGRLKNRRVSIKALN
ncbi:OmpA family protein [Flammeovirga sp. EKP202]|uniref:OmpA family protein n=1 Tax=Flammeovirga sp. EKP202 TaxID=2770592 RepID=UPI00165F9A72|nr:OmpA family protein [Flammeovirga sp. EKP202]MBD0402161.1 OmpA family protein [Flammeovirga sp. EKP202]